MSLFDILNSEIGSMKEKDLEDLGSQIYQTCVSLLCFTFWNEVIKCIVIQFLINTLLHKEN